MKIALIAAVARNGVIGHANDLLWKLPEDMAFFKRTTLGNPVIMGRKTWDSLPAKFRPLPGRTNLVVTRQVGWRADGALSASGVEQALLLCASLSPAPADVWIIGGAQLYASALPLAQRALVTELAQDVEGDTFAPRLDRQWHETARDEQLSRNGMRFAFVAYDKQENSQGNIDVQ